MGWQEELRKELDQLDDVEAFVASGEWISQITHEILPQLCRARRLAVVGVLGREDWDAQKLADSVGSRRTTIMRLAEDGRAMMRAEQRAA
jgi:hypothetical protein